mmetsp:Transcript_31966/g.99031  ORF Transcript_31966/g.99031 Transcript_31966/m.99031 type:complete len:212 (+) Transcript_31966:1124-1759(+)
MIASEASSSVSVSVSSWPSISARRPGNVSIASLRMLAAATGSMFTIWHLRSHGVAGCFRPISSRESKRLWTLMHTAMRATRRARPIADTMTMPTMQPTPHVIVSASSTRRSCSKPGDGVGGVGVVGMALDVMPSTVSSFGSYPAEAYSDRRLVSHVESPAAAWIAASSAGLGDSAICASKMRLPARALVTVTVSLSRRDRSTPAVGRTCGP